MSEDERVPPPPAGFVESVERGPFGRHNGPYFQTETAPFQHAFFVLRRHTDKLGLAHGGMLTAFMDSVLAQALTREVGRGAVTVHLSVDFLQMARAGDWVIGQATVSRATRDLGFVDGRATVGDHDIVRASGVFKLMHKAR